MAVQSSWRAEHLAGTGRRDLRRGSGDAISFWLGLRFGHLVEKHWYFVRHPDLLKLGYTFFDRFGIASVFIGRFFGPVRAVIPLVAGIMEMPVGKFWFANVASAFVWAPALLLAGTILHEIARVAGARRGTRIVASIVAAVVLTSAIWAWRRYRVWERIRASLERQ